MDRRLGVLAFGDSITNGGGELQWGVALQSWALWLARGLGVPYTGCAVDGARAGAVVAEQLPRFLAHTADPQARYDVGCLYAGVNDVRAPDWNPEAYERALGEALAFLAARCDRVLACTLPLDLGRPRAGAAVAEANAAVERSARAAGALVCDLRGFGARNRVMVDAVHPTAFGQVAIAEAALDVLAADGMAVRVRPHTLIAWETTRWRRLRGDATYAYRQAKQAARSARARARRARPILAGPAERCQGTVAGRATTHDQES
jgi:lysophospholipase L1-like esterase